MKPIELPGHLNGARSSVVTWIANPGGELLSMTSAPLSVQVVRRLPDGTTHTLLEFQLGGDQTRWLSELTFRHSARPDDHPDGALPPTRKGKASKKIRSAKPARRAVKP